MKFRELNTEEIDVRIGQVGDGYITLLLYKNARVDMDILDETVGSENWQRRHYEVKGNMYCSVGIKTGAEWVWKDDCGTESNTEKEKGESSDSFKRACVNWGIGRELYTAPKIYIKCETECKTVNGKNVYKVKYYTSFKVDSIEIKDKIITGLKISGYNRQSKEWEQLFKFGNNGGNKGNTLPEKVKEEEEKPLTYEEAKLLKMRDGRTLEELSDIELAQVVKCPNERFSKAAQTVTAYRFEHAGGELPF